MPARLRRPGPVDARSGFTLLEMTVALAIGTSLMILVLQLLDLNSRVGRVQTDLASVQQAQRAVHNLLGENVRMAGRGGLAVGNAIRVQDNVAANTTIGGNRVRAGTDILQVRGVFENVWMVDAQNPAAYTYDSATGDGVIIVDSLMPSSAIRQPLDYLAAVDQQGLQVPLIIVSAQNEATVGVAQIGGGTRVVGFDVNGDGRTEAWEKRATIEFSTSTNGNARNGSYLPLSSGGAWPATLNNAASVGILQEYWYYVRETNTAVDGNRPKLSRAEVHPNVSPAVVVGVAANGRIDIADNVVDLQIARSFDLNGNGSIDEDFENPQNDEWLGNDVADNFGNAQWQDPLVTHVGITTLIRSMRPDPSYVSPAIATLGNRDYAEPAVETDATTILDRRFRRRIHTTIVEMRNL